MIGGLRDRKAKPVISVSGNHGAPIAAALLALIGLPLAGGGARLIADGGSAYYLMFGAACIAAAMLRWRGRPAGVPVYAAALAATIVWTLWESGVDGWSALPRIGLPLLIAPVALRGGPGGRWPIAIGAALLVGGGGALLLRDGAHDPQTIDSPRSDVAAAGVATDDWPAVGHGIDSARFSPLAALTPANVGGLKLAWTYRMGMFDAPDARVEATPLVIGDTLYLCGIANQVVALDARTGRERWRFSAGLDPARLTRAICRGVAFYARPDADDCPRRIVTTTANGRMIALDADTGRRCPDFGHDGEVSLTTHMGRDPTRNINISAAPTIVGGKVIVGGGVREAMAGREAPGAIRAFDAVSGRFAWAFDPGRPHDHREPSPGADYALSTPNSWAGMSADPALGLLYVPFAGAPQDFYAGKRSPIADHMSNRIAAIDIATGALRWSFQTVHHDLWDYDVASAPSLVDVGGRRLLIQGTKQGDYFVLDRATGRPVRPVVDRPTPQGTAPDGFTAPAQPRSIAMPRLPSTDLAERDMWGLTPFDQLFCRIRFREARYEGRFTPPGFRPNIVYPSVGGGVNWGGVAIDPQRRLIVTNTNNIAHHIQLIPRGREAALQHGFARWWRERLGLEIKPQNGAPYAALWGFFASPLGLPCNRPPFGELSAIDIDSGKLVWRRRLGAARDAGMFGIASHLPLAMGLPNLGGALTTAGGLTFIAASTERAFRAYGTASGRMLWETRLPASGNTSPITYRMAGDSRQFVVLVAGGNPVLQTAPGDYVLGFALPRDQ